MVSPDGTTEICRIDTDNTNLEAAEEFVFSGLSIDRLHAHCTVHKTISVPTPTLHDREDDLAEAALRRRSNIAETTVPWTDPEQDKAGWRGEGVGCLHRHMQVSIVSNDHVVPSSTTKEAEKQRERNLAKTADDLGEFYIPMGKAPHFVTEAQLEELGGKPEVIEPMYRIRLTAVRHRSAEDVEEEEERTRQQKEAGPAAAEEEEEEEEKEAGLNTLLLDEFVLEPYERGTCVSCVRLFDESQESLDATSEGRKTSTPPRTTLRGRNLIAVGTTQMPFRGEEERSGGRVLLFRVEGGKLELVSILVVPDPVMGVAHLTMPKREIKRARETRYVPNRRHSAATKAAVQAAAGEYKVGGYLLVARGRTLETFKFRRAPGGGGRLVGWNALKKQSIVLPTDGKTGNRDKAAILAAAQDTNDPMALERAHQMDVPFDSAQLRKHGTFFNTQLFVHSLSVLSDQYGKLDQNLKQ